MDGTRQRTRLECNYLCNGCMCVCVCVCVCVCALRSMPWWVCSISPTQISAFDDISLKLVSVGGSAVIGLLGGCPARFGRAQAGQGLGFASP